jgi:hypothetical protein
MTCWRFDNYAAIFVVGAVQQVGADTVITLNADPGHHDQITLDHVTATSLTGDFITSSASPRCDFRCLAVGMTVELIECARWRSFQHAVYQDELPRQLRNI